MNQNRISKKPLKVSTLYGSNISAVTAAYILTSQVVSTILILDGTWGTTQITLLRAGLAAGISRFVPADWGTGRLSTPLIEIISTQSQVWDACEAAATAHPGRFEWASFHIGLFMNYLGLGSPHQEALAGLTDEHRFIWDIENMRAEIPLTAEGKIPRIAMTELWDVGRFLSFACELPFGQWEQDMGMAGDTKSMDEVVQIIEKVRGRKMEVTYRTFEQISSDAQVELDLVRKFWYELELAYARDVNGEGWYDTPLNDMSKGKVTPMNIEDYVTKYWGGV